MFTVCSLTNVEVLPTFDTVFQGILNVIDDIHDRTFVITCLCTRYNYM